MALTQNQIRAMHPILARKLAEIQATVGNGYQLTLLLRNANPGEMGIGNVLMTEDDPEMVRLALRHLLAPQAEKLLLPAGAH